MSQDLEQVKKQKVRLSLEQRADEDAAKEIEQRLGLVSLKDLDERLRQHSKLAEEGEGLGALW